MQVRSPFHSGRRKTDVHRTSCALSSALKRACCASPFFVWRRTEPEVRSPFSFGSMLYGFLLGCIFVYVRIVTGNILYSMMMHCTFNTVNVLLSYADIENVPIWIALLVCVIALAGFVVLTVAFFKGYSTEITVYQNLRMISSC